MLISATANPAAQQAMTTLAPSTTQPPGVWRIYWSVASGISTNRAITTVIQQSLAAQVGIARWQAASTTKSAALV